MEHHFSVELACKYGIKEAIILDNIMFWIFKNVANGHNYYDGRYWIYNSIKAWEDLFPYMTNKSIRNALQHLIDENMLVTGCYNAIKTDRTTWYSPTDEALSIFNVCTENGEWILPKGNLHLPFLANGFSQKGETIPNNKQTDNNQHSIFPSNEENITTTNKRARKVFVKPTPQEVDEYSNYLGCNIDGNQFCDYYESKGWMVGKSPMKDWKASVRTWINKKKNNEYGNSNSNNQSNGNYSGGANAQNSGAFYRGLRDKLAGSF